MRITFLTPVYPPMVSGASLALSVLSKSMAARGHRVLVITSSDRSNPYVTQEGNLSTIRLKSYHNPLRVRQRLVLWPYPEVSKALKSFSPEILHISDPFQLALPGLHYARRKKIPTVYSIQQLPWFLTSYLPKFSWLQNATERILWGYGKLLISRFDATIAPTRTITRIIYGKTKIAPQVISNGVDLNLFKPGSLVQPNHNLRKKLGIPCDVPIVLHVGRLDSEKQVDVAITACAQLLEHTNAHLLIVGDGKERTRLDRLSRELGIESKCHFTGFLSIADGLSDVYRLATAFVMTSQIETQGIVLLEAAASGVPIVAINATCIPEIVIHNVNGYLVSPDQIEKIGSHLLYLIQNPNRAVKMGMAGRKIALNHSIENSMDLYENLLTKCYETHDGLNRLERMEQKSVRRYNREYQK